jgi:uroporphyrinogen-III synthase
MSKANVVLLRAPSADTLPDPYNAAFEAADYSVASVPVLETTFVNLPELQDLIGSGPAQAGIDGVIVTSGRAGEAWSTVKETEIIASASRCRTRNAA